MRAGFAALIVLSAACARVEPPAGAAGSPALDGVWQVEDVDSGGVIDGAMLRLEFAAPGRISGRAGCNNFTGPLAYENGVARFGPLAVTGKLCAPALMDLEAKMLRRLQKPLQASLDDTGALILADGEGRLLLRRMDAASPDGRVRAIGEILWDAAAPPPGSAVLTVKLLDVSRMDVARRNPRRNLPAGRRRAARHVHAGERRTGRSARAAFGVGAHRGSGDAVFHQRRAQSGVAG